LHSGDHLRGSLDAPVHLVEYGDFECPFCGRAYPIVEAIKRLLGDQLCFAFRHFPLAATHPHALLAAEAAEAAGAQGRFWQMYDMLYQHNEALELPSIEGYAARIGLDPTEFAGDVRQQRFLDRVRADLHSGAVSGVNGTPTFFINGRRYDHAWDYDRLLQALLAEGGIELQVSS
jgi:protein-disulfide isomerase